MHHGKNSKEDLPMSSNIAVAVRNVSKFYPIYDKPSDRLRQIFRSGEKNHYRPFWALQDVTLEVAKGETVGIIGRNGSGKSTLLQLICGTVACSSGEVRTFGRISALLELGSGFNPEFTGRENVFLNAAVLGLSDTEIAARFDEIVEFADIGEFIDQPIKSYSSGMVIRLAFAVSVCVEPDILVVDEALAVGDAAFQFKCLKRLDALTRQGTTLLFVSHDIHMVKQFCNRVLYLDRGRTRACGTPDEMAELYLLDLRDEQRRRSSNGGVRMSSKAPLGDARGISFGTEEGEILSAAFTNTGEQSSCYGYGENIEIHVTARISNTVALPNISFTVQEARLLVVGGQNFRLRPRSDESGWQMASITVQFPAMFAVGRFYITVKLLDGYTENTSNLIEKRVALLSFDLLPGGKDFLGMVDLNIEQLPGQHQAVVNG